MMTPEQEKLLRRLVELEERKVPRKLSRKEAGSYLWLMVGVAVAYGGGMAYSFWRFM